MSSDKVDKIENILIEIQGELGFLKQKTSETSGKMDKLIYDNSNITFAIYGGKGLKKNSVLSRLEVVENEITKVRLWMGSVKVSWAVIGTLVGVLSPFVYVVANKFIDKIFK